MRMRTALRLLALTALAFLHSAPVSAANRFAVASTAWNLTSTWSATSGGAAGASIPVAGDDVFIGDTATARAVSIPAGYAAAATSVTIATTAGVAGAKTLTLAAATSSLTLTGNLTLNRAGANTTTNELFVNAGTVSVGGNVTLGGTNTTTSRIARITITTGTLNITGNLVFITGAAASNVLLMSGGAGTVNLGGAFTATVGTLTPGTTSTFNYNGTVAQTVRIATSTIVYNHLHINNSNAAGATLSAAVSATNVLGSLRVQTGILNNGGFAMVGGAGDTFQVANGARFNLTGTSAMATGFTKSFGATSTVNYKGGVQTVSAETYGHLILDTGSTKTPAAGTTTIAGNFTLGAATTYAGTTSNPTVNLAGNFTNSGTFNSGTTAFTFNGTAAQTLTGTTTFTRLTLNNTAAVATQTVTINNDVTVSTALAFTSGRIVTSGTTKVIIPSGGTVTGASAAASRFVAGRLQKFAAAGAPTVTFEIGTDGALEYSPVTLVFVGVAVGGGSLIAFPTTGDHPQIASSGLDSTKSVNRWWTLTTTGVTGTALPAFTSFSPTFTFIAGDVDVGATTGSFEIERYSGAVWSTTAAGTRAALTTEATGVTALGEFAVAEKIPPFTVGGSFNAFESSTGAAAITGVIKTRISGSTFSLDVVAIYGGAKYTTFNNNVKVELLGNTVLGVALDAQNCPTSSTVVQTIASTAIASGRSAVSFSAVSNAWRDVRVRVSYPTVTPTVVWCSTDNFAIRPNAFSNLVASDLDAATAGTTRTLNNTSVPGGTVHKAGRPFTVRADAMNAAGTPAVTNNYTGSPTAALSACAGTGCTSTFGTATLGTAFTAGQLNTSTASYDQVGSFALQLTDSSFASVDTADSTAAEREITSSAVSVGRFVPDHFAVSYNTPVFGPTCAAGSFSYVGQTFSYTTQPVITVTAQNFANGTTTLYAGAWWQITNASLTGKAYAAMTGTLNTGGAPGTDPVIAASGSGIGTLTFGSGTGFFFARTTPLAPFNAEIRLQINVIDADGVTLAGAAQFGGITPGTGITFGGAAKEFRFGRLRLQNANGSQLTVMPIPMHAQYWNGSGFVTNTLDVCTTVAASNVALGNYQKNLGSGETTVTAGGAFSAGVGSLRLSAPGAANNGSVDVSVNLSAVAAGAACTPPAMPVSTPSGMSHLQGAWCGAVYDRDPRARATFETIRKPDQVIHQRENF